MEDPAFAASTAALSAYLALISPFMAMAVALLPVATSRPKGADAVVAGREDAERLIAARCRSRTPFLRDAELVAQPLHGQTLRVRNLAQQRARRFSAVWLPGAVQLAAAEAHRAVFAARRQFRRPVGVGRVVSSVGTPRLSALGNGEHRRAGG